MFKDDVSLAQDKDDWDYVIQRSKMNMDVILCYVKGLGEKGKHFELFPGRDIVLSFVSKLLPHFTKPSTQFKAFR